MSIYRWSHLKFLNKTKIKSENRLCKEMIDVIKSIVSEDPFQTCNTLKIKLETIFNKKISNSLCYNALKLSGITRKKIRYNYLTKQYKEKLEIFKSNVFNLLKEKSLNKFVFIDETGIKNYTYPLYGYSMKGTVIIKRKKVSNKSKSLCVAISQDGIVDYQCIDKSFKTTSFKTFLEKCNFPVDTVIVLDNASIHKNKQIISFCNQKKWNLCFTPPGTPDCNPIENFFGIFKNKYRNHCLQNDIVTKENIDIIDSISSIFKDIHIKTSFIKLIDRAIRFWERI
jgi:transposase